MAKFIQSVTPIPQTTEGKNEHYETIKKDFAKYKNPFASQNPFKDGEDLEIEGIVPVSWKHETYGEGEYLAFAFKNKSETLALSSLVKEATGYATGSVSDTEAKDFRNPDEGLAKILREGWSEATFDKILAAIKNKKKRKIKLTHYYVNRGDNRKKCSLTNLL